MQSRNQDGFTGWWKRMVTYKDDLKVKRRQSAFCMIYLKDVTGNFPIL
jgi:hypothetical protein